MQVYRKLDIGTAKPTLKEQNLVPHHQIDIVDPNENYSAGKYEREASNIVEEIHTFEFDANNNLYFYTAACAA